jgi:DNA (cytosine-5)-methyltransferase 1
MNTPHDLFIRVREIYSQRDIAQCLDVDVRTVRRWEKAETPVPEMARASLKQLLSCGIRIAEEPATYRIRTQPFPSFRFIDLFAGIGGTRLGFEAAGGTCVFTSEWDKFACQTYRANHSDDHEIAGDITKVDPKEIPDHEVLVGGFPCQPFSLAGVSKKNSLGRAHGFSDPTQGTLFFNIVQILKEKQPRAFLLENVKHLERHDKGNTFRVIIQKLRKELDYHVEYRVINSASFVPQKRQRIFIVGFREYAGFNWDSVQIPPMDRGPRLGEILHKPHEVAEEPYTETFRGKTRVAPRYTLTDHLWNYLTNYAKKHAASGNGFGCSVVGPDDIARTLSARYHKDGSEILIDQRRGNNPRRLTPRECARLMGFPDSFKIPVSDTQAYRQFGNSVVVPVIQAIAKPMAACLSGNPLPAVSYDEQLRLAV